MFGCELGTPDAGEINGREPLDVTAKNGAPGGSFCCGRRDGGGKVVKCAVAGFLGLSGVCCACGWLHHFANVGNMVGVWGCWQWVGRL